MKLHSKILVSSSLFLLGAVLASAAPAAENWESHCARCHGADGKGKTKIGAKLKLQDYTDAAVQAKLTDADMAKVITEGFKDASGKEKMKAYSPELSPAEITDLVAYIRKFKA